MIIYRANAAVHVRTCQKILNQSVSEWGQSVQQCLFIQKNKKLTIRQHSKTTRIHKQVQDIFFFYLFQTLSFALLLFFSLRLSTDLPEWCLLTLLLFCFLSLLRGEMLSRRGSAVASSEEDSSFYRRMKQELRVSRPRGVIEGRGLLLLSRWGGVCICVLVCLVGMNATHTLFNQWCSSRHRTTGEALVEQLLLSSSSSCFFLWLGCDLKSLQTSLIGDYWDVSVLSSACLHYHTLIKKQNTTTADHQWTPVNPSSKSLKGQS